jgi:hypothetical protein
LSSDQQAGEALSSRRDATAVVRLVLEADGTVRHGELLDTTGRLHRRFAGWDGLVVALRSWIAQHAQDDPS